ncbi:MAG: LPS assembly lipoprotein LptE [Roseovarius sp.]
MSSCNRRSFLLGSSALAVAGCGFTPAYAPGGAATRLQNSILVDEPKEREDYLFTRRVEERLGRPSPADYALSYSIAISEQPIAISANNVITRFNMLGTITYALRDMTTEKVLTSGKVDSFTSYSAAGTTVATQAARSDAEERLMTILADQMITRLTAEADTLPA